MIVILKSLSISLVRVQIKYKFSLTTVLTSLCYGAFECVNSFVPENKRKKVSNYASLLIVTNLYL